MYVNEFDRLFDVADRALERGYSDAITSAIVMGAAVMIHAKATRAIAHGDNHAPGGLEGLAMAIAGTGLSSSLSSAVESVAEAVRENSK